MMVYLIHGIMIHGFIQFRIFHSSIEMSGSGGRRHTIMHSPSQIPGIMWSVKNHKPQTILFSCIFLSLQLPMSP